MLNLDDLATKSLVLKLKLVFGKFVKIGVHKGIESLPQTTIFYSIYLCTQLFHRYLKLYILLD